jgi:hypothetical protein
LKAAALKRYWLYPEALIWVPDFDDFQSARAWAVLPTTSEDASSAMTSWKEENAVDLPIVAALLQSFLANS